jgi:hypothetical protein
MERQIDYCARVAVECARRAEETDEKEEREFLYRMRDNWLRVASGLQSVGDGQYARISQSDHRLPTTFEPSTVGLRQANSRTKKWSILCSGSERDQT